MAMNTQHRAVGKSEKGERAAVIATYDTSWSDVGPFVLRQSYLTVLSFIPCIATLYKYI